MACVGIHIILGGKLILAAVHTDRPTDIFDVLTLYGIHNTEKISSILDKWVPSGRMALL